MIKDKMDKARFPILKTLDQAIDGVYHMRAPLLSLAIFPLAVHAACAWLALFFNQHLVLMMLPAQAAVARMNFLHARLFILNEAPPSAGNKPPPSPAYQKAREASIFLSLTVTLLLMAVLPITAMIVTLLAPFLSGSVLYILFLMLIAGLLWLWPFSVAPLVIAVEYPLGLFLRKTQSFSFSLRLLALQCLCFLPLFLVTLLDYRQMLLKNMGQWSVLLESFIVVSCTLLSNTACLLALKEVLGRKGSTS